MTDANAVRYFQDKLAYETSAREVVAAVKAGDKMTIVDVRRAEAYNKGHIVDALNLSLDDLANASRTLDTAKLTRAALSLASQGFRVRELLGGFEYWMRMGLSIEGPDGIVKHRVADSMVTTAPVGWD